jgi:Tfp pilus assembly protein PilF
VDPSNVRAYYIRASAWVKNRRDDLAIQDYERLLQITPDDIQSR